MVVVNAGIVLQIWGQLRLKKLELDEEGWLPKSDHYNSSRGQNYNKEITMVQRKFRRQLKMLEKPCHETTY